VEKTRLERRSFELRLEADRRLAEEEVEHLLDLDRDERMAAVRRARSRYRERGCGPRIAASAPDIRDVCGWLTPTAVQPPTRTGHPAGPAPGAVPTSPKGRAAPACERPSGASKKPFHPRPRPGARAT
jgi:hypothetical protein